MLQRILIAIVLVGSVSCELCNAGGTCELKVVPKDTVSVSTLGRIEGNKILIVHDVDLKGTVCKLPKGITLVIKKGIIRNGTLIGNNTQIECKNNAFDKVTIQGTWNVPEISTKLFKDLSYENALKDVVALSSPKVMNSIIFEEGEYKVKANRGSATCISICGNTELTINGTIRLLPNDLESYNIIAVKGKNVRIGGKGAIIGDKHTHTGTEGEWGMGINLKGAVNTTISGLTIKDCWGDCIYVGGNSKNVLIEKCKLDHGRRQGISITKARSVTIRNCKITNVSGKNPQYAIDIEPNANDTVDNVIIEKVEVKNCEGGILATKGLKSEKTRIGNFEIRNCSLSAVNKYPIRLRRSQSALVEKCIVNGSNARAAMYLDDVQKVVIKNNIINITKEILSTVKNSAKTLAGKKGYSPIYVRNVTYKDIKCNIINKK